MDLRSEPRFPTDGPVTITVLGPEPSTISGRIVNVSGRGMRFMLDAPVPANAAIRADVEGTLLLGEVAYCYPEGKAYAAGIQLEQALTVSEELCRLMRHLNEEAANATRV
ncbi:MAG: PilZ domain-containing protein [Bryobacteraceae bacterium]